MSFAEYLQIIAWTGRIWRSDIPESMEKETEKHGCRKMYGIGHSRAIFDKPPQSSA